MSAPLYSSNKDIGAPEQEIAIFQPEEFGEVVINKPPVSQVPIYSQTYIPTKLVQTINSDDIPTVTSQQVNVDVKMLADMYSTDEALKIIKDIENDVPLSQQTAERIVTSGIVSDPNQPKIIEKVVKKSKKKGIINGITDFVYNLLYKRK